MPSERFTFVSFHGPDSVGHRTGTDGASSTVDLYVTLLKLMQVTPPPGLLDLPLL
ncbi:hypothetical protein KBA41_08795 [Candidatus Ozemobacteraceae bacterium]|nr:hypothetical protein [Candidatus Ozemobacteraceae bacterium]